MGMAITMREYLESSGVPYETVAHPRETTASRIAQQSHVAGDLLAKAVLLTGESGYMLAVLPSTCRASLADLSRMLDERVGLATEQEIDLNFRDCDHGAVPPVGQPYGLPVCVDEALDAVSDVYFEAGDHETLVHMRGEDFRRLMADAMHGRFARHM